MYIYIYIALAFSFTLIQLFIHRFLTIRNYIISANHFRETS